MKNTDFWTTFLGGLITGVVAAIVAAALISVTKAGWKRTFEVALSWITRQQGEDITGIWKSPVVNKQEYSYTYNEVITVKHRSMYISGKLDYHETERSDSRASHKIFKVKGVYRNGLLAAYYYRADGGSVGCIALRWAGDGKMEGGCIYYEPRLSRVVKDDYSWERE